MPENVLRVGKLLVTAEKVRKTSELGGPAMSRTQDDEAGAILVHSPILEDDYLP